MAKSRTKTQMSGLQSRGRQTRPGYFDGFSVGGLSVNGVLGIIPRRAFDAASALFLERMANGKADAVRAFAETMPLRLLRVLLTTHEMGSMALSNDLSFTFRPGAMTLVAVKDYASGKGMVDESETHYLSRLWNRLDGLARNEIIPGGQGGGLESLQKALARQQTTDGLSALECVIGEDGVSDIIDFDPLSVRFRDTDAGRVVQQRQADGSDGGWETLDLTTVRVSAWNGSRENPYGAPRLGPFLGVGLADTAEQRSLRDWLHAQAWPRLAFEFPIEQWVAYATDHPDILEGLGENGGSITATEWAEREAANMKAVCESLTSSDFILMATGGKASALSPSPGGGLGELLTQRRLRVAQSLDHPPALIGITDGGTQAYATVQMRQYGAKLTSVAHDPDRAVEWIANLDLRARGMDMIARVEREPIVLTDALVDQQARQLEINNILTLVDRGMLDPERGGLAADRHRDRRPVPRLCAGVFRQHEDPARTAALMQKANYAQQHFERPGARPGCSSAHPSAVCGDPARLEHQSAEPSTRSRGICFGPPLSFWLEDEEDDAAAPSGYTVTAGGIAIVPLHGTLVDSEPSWWMSYLGYCSIPQIARSVAAADADPTVKDILLDVKSPGGHVSGLAAACDAVWAVRQRGAKRIWAACSQACSAAYEIASQCERLYLAPDGMGGCIGTLYLLSDWSGYYTQMGVVKLRVASDGADVYKGAGAMGTKITSAQIADYKRLCNEFRCLFNGIIQRGRGFSDATMLALADGRVHIGANALQLSLVDGIATPEAVLSALGGGDDLDDLAGPPAQETDDDDDGDDDNNDDGDDDPTDRFNDPTDLSMENNPLSNKNQTDGKNQTTDQAGRVNGFLAWLRGDDAANEAPAPQLSNGTAPQAEAPHPVLQAALAGGLDTPEKVNALISERNARQEADKTAAEQALTARPRGGPECRRRRLRAGHDAAQRSQESRLPPRTASRR